MIGKITRRISARLWRPSALEIRHSALIGSPEPFQLLVESVKEYAIFMLDPAGHIATWNPGATRIKGYEPSEVIGKHCSIFYSQEDILAGKPQAELTRAENDGRFRDEGWRVRKDGSRFWASVVVTALRGENQRLLGFARLTRDLTERKIAEDQMRQTNEDLRKSQNFLTSILENIPNMVFVKEARDLRFVRFNKAGEELLGYPRQALIGKNDYDFFPKDQADFFTQKDRAVFTGESVVDIPEEEIQTKFLGTRFLHTRKIPMFGLNGKPEYLLGISEDITERKIAEHERLRVIREQATLAERERAMERMTILSDASAVLASSLNYQETLPILARLTVPSLADWCTVAVIGENPNQYDRVAAIHHDPIKNGLLSELVNYYPIDLKGPTGIAMVIRSGKSVVAHEVPDEVLVSAATSERSLSLMREVGCASYMIVPISARGKTHGAIVFALSSPDRTYSPQDVAVAEEIGQRAGMVIDNALLYRAAQSAIRVRDDFLSIASHELKTPLTALQLQLELLRRSTMPEKNILPDATRLAKMLDAGSVQVNRLTALVDDLLDVSRIEAGKLSFNFEPVELSALMNEMAERYQDHLKSSGSILRLVAAGPLWIHADRFRLEQVLLNVISNAAKYGAGRAIELEVKRTQTSALIVCRDNGVGIPEHKLQSIFERFERAYDINNVRGLGLGLYITREIVRGHDGTIQVESTLGVGSTFTIELPIAPNGKHSSSDSQRQPPLENRGQHETVNEL